MIELHIPKTLRIAILFITASKITKYKEINLTKGMKNFTENYKTLLK